MVRRVHLHLFRLPEKRKERSRSHSGTTPQPSAVAMSSNERFLMKEIRRIQFANDRRYRDLGRTLHVVLNRVK